MSAREAAVRAFRERYGDEPEGVAFAPGRVNLIGEHVDYNDGLVLPMPVAQGTAVAWERTDEDAVEILAADMPADDRFSLMHPVPPDTIDWRSYCRGMVAFAPVKPLRGPRMAVAGDLARGVGLSSSASLCVAIGRALADAVGTTPDPVALAQAAQRAEHEFAGVACGIMDQMAVAAGGPGEAMLLDCRDLSYRAVVIPDDWAVLVVSSGVTRGLVEGEYNLRREQCAEAARLLGVRSLREVPPGALHGIRLPDSIDRRARHVVSEITRVREAEKALLEGDMHALSGILRDGHASLRDLFEVSVPAVDVLVDRLQDVLGDDGGARMTGAGFGGSVVVVARRPVARRLIDELGKSATAVYGLASG